MMKRLKGQRGAALIETAITLPIILLVYAYDTSIDPYINRVAVRMYGSTPYTRQRRLKSTATADQRQQAPTSGSEPVRLACQAIGMFTRAPEMDVWTMSPSSKASSAQ